MIRKKIVFFALLMCMVSSIKAQIKMMVLSDTHVMSKQLIVNDGTAWQTALSNDRKLLDYSQEIFDALIDTVLVHKPDLLLITGYLTKDGELLSHQYVVAGLDKLREVGINTYVIPGNHDLGTSNALVFDGDNTSKAEVVSATDFAKMYSNYGYGAYSTRESTTLTYACEPMKGVVLIGIDSGTNGSLSETTLNWVCGQAEKAKEQGKQVVAMMHHALVPHFVGVNKVVSSAHVKNYENVRNRLANSGVRVVFTGHFHASDIAKDYNADFTEHIYDVSTGSAVSYPCDFRELSLNMDRSQLAITSGHIKSLENDANFSKTAKDRLHASLKKIANGKVNNDMLADFISISLACHAEGNEDLSKDARNVLIMYNFGKASMVSNATVNSNITRMGLTWNDIDATFNSMLKNISSYDDEERQSVTNDLTLTIDMPHLKIKGDIDQNGEVDITDVVALVNIILGKNSIENIKEADVDDNGVLNISDVSALVNMILKKQ